MYSVNTLKHFKKWLEANEMGPFKDTFHSDASEFAYGADEVLGEYVDCHNQDAVRVSIIDYAEKIKLFGTLNPQFGAPTLWDAFPITESGDLVQKDLDDWTMEEFEAEMYCYAVSTQIRLAVNTDSSIRQQNLDSALDYCNDLAEVLLKLGAKKQKTKSSNVN